MIRFLVAIPFLVAVTAASAQSAHPDPGCARDVTRYCRAKINDGDMVVLGCLKEHRSRLSKACANALASHGQ